MKKTYLFVTLMVLFLTVNLFGQWQLTDQTGVKDVSFVNASTGYLIKTDKQLYRGNNTNWTSIYTFSDSLRSVYAYSNLIFVIVKTSNGYNALYKSINNGSSFSELSTNLGTGSSFKMIFINSHGFIVNQNLKNLFTSNNTGDNWSPDTLRLNYITNDNNILYGTTDKSIFKSTNYGINWTLENLSIPLGTDYVFYNISVKDLGYASVKNTQNNSCALWKKINNIWTSIKISTNLENSVTYINGLIIWGNQYSNDDIHWNDNPENFNKVTYTFNAPDDFKCYGLCGDSLFISNTTITNINTNTNITKSFTLHQNYPNPFNPSTKISYTLTKKDFVTLKVYNIKGQAIETLVNTNQVSGNHEITFKNTDLSSGLYYYTLTTSEGSITKTMILIK